MPWLPLLVTLIAFIGQNIYFCKEKTTPKDRIIYGLKLIPCSFEFVIFITLKWIEPLFDYYSEKLPVFKYFNPDPYTNSRIYVYVILILLVSISIYAFCKVSGFNYEISVGEYLLFTMIDCISLMFVGSPLKRYFFIIAMYLFGFLIERKDVIYAIGHSKYYTPTKAIIWVTIPIPLHLALVCFMSPEDRATQTFLTTQRTLNIAFCIMLFVSSVMIIKLLLIGLRRTIHIQQDMELQDFLMDELMQSQEGVILTFSEIVSNKSGETGNHVIRVAGYTAILAQKLGYPEEAVEEIRLASMMHDIGKLMVSNKIIEKPGPLTSEEFNEMKKHVVYGEKLLSSTKGGILEKARIIAKQHHERWDGKGYVMGLKGDEISELAQIVAVADVFDALTSRRSYKEPWPCSLARKEIVKNRGSQFSPKCVDAFEKSYAEFLAVRKAYPDETGINAANDGLIVSAGNKELL